MERRRHANLLFLFYKLFTYVPYSNGKRRRLHRTGDAGTVPPMKTPVPGPTRQILALTATLVLPLAILNGLVNSARYVTTGSVAALLAPVAETAVVMALVIFSAGRQRERNRDRARSRGASALLTTGAIILAVSVLFSASEALVQYVWGRSFYLFSDAPMLRSVFQLFFGEIGRLAYTLVPIAVALIVLAATALSMAALLLVRRMVTAAGIARRPSFSFGILAAALVFALASGGTGIPRIARSLQGAPDLEFRSISTHDTVHDEPDSSNAPDDSPGKEDRAPRARLFDRDIHLFLIEAYGYAVFSRETLQDMLHDDLHRLDQALRDQGYFIASTAMDSPVFGGFSWLAETSLLTGQVVGSQTHFEQLAELARQEPIPSLPRTLHDRGYYTVAVKPGTVHGSWPEGWDIFRFERSLVAHDGDFNYRGPWFSYVAVTDQFAIWAAHEHIREAREPGGVAEGRSAFVHYQLVSSHTPFNKIPWYIPDWQDLGDGSIYNEESHLIRHFNNSWGGGTEMDEGYTASIGYVLETIAGYVEKHLDNEENPVLIITGDHQAQRPIREQDAGPGVPVHVATRDEHIYEAFLAEGFEPGFFSVPPPPHRHLADLYPLLLRVAR